MKCFTYSLGKPHRKRLYLMGLLLSSNQFVPGAYIEIDIQPNITRIKLSDEYKGRTITNSKKGPIIDIDNNSFRNSMAEYSEVEVRFSNSLIEITPAHSEKMIQERESEFKNRRGLDNHIRAGSLCTGIGHLDTSICRGLRKSGFNPKLAFMNEIDPVAASIAATCNEELLKHALPDAVFYNGDLFKINHRLVPKLDILSIGYPCKKFSRLITNSDNRDISGAEGTLFVPVLNVIKLSNPAIVVMENSDRMKGSNTLAIMDDVMKRWGYKTSSTIVRGVDHGDLEVRPRLAKIWVSEGLVDINLEQMKTSDVSPRYLSDVIEPIESDAEQWKSYEYLKAKNYEIDNNHRHCVYLPSATRISAFTASYQKAQPDTPFIAHPTNTNLSRLFSPSEHCNVKRVYGKLKQAIVDVGTGDYSFIKSNRSNLTLAHTLLGNSVAPLCWEDVGEYIGRKLYLPIIKKSYSSISSILDLKFTY